ncbi:MAG: hypothetical protein WCL44_13770 [bacterium]
MRHSYMARLAALSLAIWLTAGASAMAGTNTVYVDNLVVTNTFAQTMGGTTNYFLGRIGVGTAQPAADLHVAGSVLVDGAVTLPCQGDVGMGTYTNGASTNGVSPGYLPAGSQGAMLYHDGTNWCALTNLYWNSANKRFYFSGSTTGSYADTASGNLVLGGTLDMGGKAVSNAAGVVPNTGNQYDLGTAAKQWKDLYVDGVEYVDEIRMDDSQKVRLGTGQDFELYFDGTTAYLDNLGTSNSDVNIRINDGGTTRTGMTIHASEGSVSFPRQSAVFAYRNTDFTVSNITEQILPFTGERFDVLGEYSTTTGVFTAKTPGRYWVSTTVHWLAVNANQNYMSFIVKGSTLIARQQSQYPQSGNLITQNLSAVVDLQVGETISVHVFQSSGGNETVYSCGTADMLTLSIMKGM